MSSHLSIQEIRALPKVDLHRHLDCSMRWSTMLEIATSLGLEIPKIPSQQQAHFLVAEPMSNLQAVLNKFLTTQKLLASEQILERLAFECCEDAFNDGVRILELRYAPTFIASGHTHLSFENIHQALLKGIEKAKKSFPIAVGLICILQRILDLKTVDHVTSFAIENKNTFLAIDLADNEDGFEPKNFAPYFQRAKKAGLNITVHTGEAPDPKAGQYIMDSIDILGAQRIGHGVQVIHHPNVMNVLIEKDIPLEICPYSNYLTQAFKTHKEHPLRKLFDSGVPVTLNSDDPGIFASVLSDDYLIVQAEQNFSLANFQKCNQTAYTHSFISESEKSKVWG